MGGTHGVEDPVYPGRDGAGQVFGDNRVRMRCEGDDNGGRERHEDELPLDHHARDRAKCEASGCRAQRCVQTKVSL